MAKNARHFWHLAFIEGKGVLLAYFATQWILSCVRM